MGCNMCKKKTYQKINYLAPEDKEIEIKDYSSQNDKNLEILETKINLFNFVQLVEFVNLLEQFSIETSTIITDEPMRTKFTSTDEFLNQDINVEEFQSFIENKIFNLEDLSDIMETNQQYVPIFKEMCIDIYKALQLKLGQHYNDDQYILKKRNLLAIGMLFCTCENIEKIKLLFDIFKNEKDEKEEFCKSNELDNYLLSLFLIGSYCLISARNKINNPKLSIAQLEKEDLKQLVSFAELKDCENLVKIFNESFFKQEQYNWNEFKKKFENIENGFGWVISSKGIRRKLEQNNI
jgi:hypothetical protein